MLFRVCEKDVQEFFADIGGEVAGDEVELGVGKLAEPVAQEDVTVLEPVLLNVFTGVVNGYEIFVHHIARSGFGRFRKGDTDRAVSAAEVETGIAISDFQVFQ